MVNWIVVQVHQNLCVVESSVGKNQVTHEESYWIIGSIEFPSLPYVLYILALVVPLLIHLLFVPGRDSFVYRVFCWLPDLVPNDDIRRYVLINDGIGGCELIQQSHRCCL